MTMRYHHFFEWHEQKAETNKRKHRVTFEDAAAVLADDQADRHHLERYDDKHSMGGEPIRHDRVSSGQAEHRPLHLLDPEAEERGPSRHEDHQRASRDSERKGDLCQSDQGQIS
jgi:hypothetical protein